MKRLTQIYKEKRDETYINLIGGNTIYPMSPKKTSLVQCAIAKLYRYEETGLDPEAIRKMDRLYVEKCEEVIRLQEEVRRLAEACDKDAKGRMESLIAAEEKRLGVGSDKFMEKHREIMKDLEEMEKGEKNATT